MVVRRSQLRRIRGVGFDVLSGQGTTSFISSLDFAVFCINVVGSESSFDSLALLLLWLLIQAFVGL